MPPPRVPSSGGMAPVPGIPGKLSGHPVDGRTPSPGASTGDPVAGGVTVAGVNTDAHASGHGIEMADSGTVGTAPTIGTETAGTATASAP